MRFLALCFLACLGASLEAQNTAPPPDFLLDAGHCLATADGDWFGISQENPYTLELGSASANEVSGDGDMFYLIDYTSPTHSEGYAFAFEHRGRGSHREMTLEFRIGFKQTVDGTQQVHLTNSPLGGIGTQDEVLRAIQRVGFHTWKIPVADLRNHSSGAACKTSDALR